MEGWFLQIEGGERTKIQDLDEDFHEGLKELQARGEGLIPAGVDIGEDMSLQRSLRIGSTKEATKKGLDTSVIYAKNTWRKRGRVR